jgi:hypothetical protein
MTEIKILKGLASQLVSDRKKRTKYVTNRILKAFDLFICLKAQTTSGHIKDYRDQINTLLPFCKCGYSTFWTRLNELEDLKLIEFTGGGMFAPHISLASWQKVAEMYDIVSIDFITVRYDEKNKLQNVEYILKAVEILENQQAQATQAKRKLNKTPEIQDAFDDFYKKQNKKVDFNLVNLFELQKETFSLGAADYDALHAINPDVNRSSMRMKDQYQFHSIRNVAYMKRQLKKRGLADVKHREAPVCRYKEHVNPKASKTRTKDAVRLGAVIGLMIPSAGVPVIKKGTKTHEFTTFYHRENHAKIWRLSDSIEINTKIFK